MDVLDAAAVHRWSTAALAALETDRADLDALNVFPVPDGDTGTNLVATIRSARDALAGRLNDTHADPPDAHTAFVALSRGAARGAVGNSGFIVSQLLRGLAEAPSGGEGWDAAVLCAGLDAGARLGRDAVVVPVDGTILTVARAAADAAARELSDGDATLAGVSIAATRAADAAVRATPSQLAHLAAAGVVDAGGRGLLVLLDALARTLGDRLPPLRPVDLPTHRRPRQPGEPDDPPREDAPQWEVQYLLAAPSGSVPALRTELAAVGESVAVVPTGEPDAWKVHVHTSDVGAAVDAGLRAGRPHGVEIVALDGGARVPGRSHPRTSGPTSSEQTSDGEHATSVVAVAPGAELAHLFAREGVHVVGTPAAPESPGGPESAPDQSNVADVVAAIHGSAARQVILLPNAARGAGVAELAAQRARADGIRVTVVPTRSPVQGLAAVAVHDPRRRFDDDVVAMAEAAAATRFAEVSAARERALTAVGMCEPGDVLGLIDGEVVEIGRDLLSVALSLLDRLLGIGAELITVLVGRDAPPRAGELLEGHVREHAPLTDVAVHHGGHPDRPVIIGAE